MMFKGVKTCRHFLHIVYSRTALNCTVLLSAHIRSGTRVERKPRKRGTWRSYATDLICGESVSGSAVSGI